MSAYEARRLENIKRNEALIKDLGIQHVDDAKETIANERPVKRRKVEDGVFRSRTSARIASKPTPQLFYNEDEPAQQRAKGGTRLSVNVRRKGGGFAPQTKNEQSQPGDGINVHPVLDLEELRGSWSSWVATAPAPVRDENHVYHFVSNPEFVPNKSPEEVLREGCFGGSYFRPLYSKSLGITVADDWQELPVEWTRGLKVERYLISASYDPEVNKYKVKCGQSIEEWEANGWIDHRYDVRGWFQWYCRFFAGRRCEDDDRQISRWQRCVGAKGRWRLALLRKYVKLGVKDVFDDGEQGEDTAEVSPVVHQTCHHWAFEVRQDVLDTFWRNPK